MRDGNNTGLHHASDGRFMIRSSCANRCIAHNVSIIPLTKRAQCRKCDSALGMNAGKNEALPCSLGNRLGKRFVLPRIHSDTHDCIGIGGKWMEAGIPGLLNILSRHYRRDDGYAPFNSRLGKRDPDPDQGLPFDGRQIRYECVSTINKYQRRIFGRNEYLLRHL